MCEWVSVYVCVWTMSTGLPNNLIQLCGVDGALGCLLCWPVPLGQLVFNVIMSLLIEFNMVPSTVIAF